ncbi:hypothetical protein [Ferruginibacter profundus]
MTLIKSVTAALLVLFFISCSKEESATGTGTPIVPGVPDSTYLDTVFFSNRSNSLLYDSSVLSFSYDNLKRVTVVVAKNFTTGSIVPVEGGTLNYFYTSQDTLPFKAELVRTYDAGASNTFDTATAYFYYDGQQNLIRDSIIERERVQNSSPTPNHYTISKHIYNITVQSQRIISAYSYVKLQEQNIPTFNTYKKYYINDSTDINSFGNAVQTLLHGDTSLPMLHPSNQKYLAEFDSKPSPFARLNIFKSFNSSLQSTDPLNDFFYFGDNPVYNSKNNFTKYSGFTASYNYVFNFANIYLPNAYLSKSTYTTTDPSTITLRYKYKAL